MRLLMYFSKDIFRQTFAAILRHDKDVSDKGTFGLNIEKSPSQLMIFRTFCCNLRLQVLSSMQNKIFKPRFIELQEIKRSEY